MRNFEEYILELEGPMDEGAYSRLMGALGLGAAVAGAGAAASYQMGPYDHDPFAQPKSAHVRMAEPQDYSPVSKHEVPVVRAKPAKKKVNPVPPKNVPHLQPPEGFKRKVQSEPDKNQGSLAGAIPKAMDIVKRFEGFYPNKYWDVNGYAIGYGSKRHNFPGNVVPDTISQAQAEALLAHNLENKYGKVIQKYVRVPLNDNQKAALISFIYNLGPHAFSRSSVLSKLNQADYQGAADSILKYEKSQGQVLKGLTKRRQAERDLFLAGSEKV